jgi:hypothetical protein
MTPATLSLAEAAMAKRDTKVSDLCTELSVTRRTLYRLVGPKGELPTHEFAQAHGVERKLMKEHGTNNRALINPQTWSQSDPTQTRSHHLRAPFSWSTRGLPFRSWSWR